jgi:endogenous inhibitor of DNA gyrase (YacG/DUF329 family)
MTQPVRTVACPQCGTLIAWSTDNPYRPFCSERCKLIDLGAWANERYRIADEHSQDADPHDDEQG